MVQKWAAATGKEKGRLASELGRKYKLNVNRHLRPDGTIHPDYRELAAIRAADKTMHAFGPSSSPSSINKVTSSSTR
jgi:hypothetical protein